MDKPEESYSLDQALKAQRALRAAAGLSEERFPLSAFVGMVSDEIETLRTQGRSDEEIAHIIGEHSEVRLSAEDIREHYAPADKRHGQ